MTAAGHPQVQALAALYRRPPDRPNDEAPPGERQGFEAPQGHANGIARKEYRKRPAAGTIRADVLDALLAGRSLTGLEAWREFGTSRLAADIHALRRMGWDIAAEEIPVDCRKGRSARVAVYRLANTAGGRQ